LVNIHCHKETFSNKLKRNNITGDELLNIAKLLSIDLEKLKNEI